MRDPMKYTCLSTVNRFDFGRVPQDEAHEFIERYEWLGYAGRGFICYGLWQDGMLYGVELFSITPPFVGKLFPYAVRLKTITLSRGACCLEAGPHAGSMLIGACLRDLKRLGYWLVIAHSDPAAGEHGTIYKAANAIQAGTSNVRGRRYLKIDGKWYPPSSIHQRFGKRGVPRRMIEGVKIDRTAKTRWVWILDQSVRPYLPRQWMNRAA
jgi:hypothetical protein